jgi:MFS family permease
MFVVLAVIWGLGYDIVGVFYHSFFKEFGWSHAQFSRLATSFSISFLIGGLLVGWLLDRVGAQYVITGGALVVITGLLIASRANSLNDLTFAYFLLGLGNGAGVVPVPLVINNWFSEGRGLAMGVALMGLPTGEMTMAWMASYMIAGHGWRNAYAILSVLVLVLVIPFVLITVRTRPAGTGTRQSVKESAQALPGLELGPALHSRAFHMAALMYLFYGLAVSVALVHEVIHLQEIGYTPEQAGKVWGFLLGSTLFTRAVMGFLADRIGSRNALMVSFCGFALTMIANLGSRNLGVFVLFGIGFAFTMGAPAVILPVFLSELLGLKRYGTFVGLMNASASVGLAIGPIVAGRIFDMTGSYNGAFGAAAVISILAAVATALCIPPSAATQEPTIAAAPAAGAVT